MCLINMYIREYFGLHKKLSKTVHNLFQSNISLHLFSNLLINDKSSNFLKRKFISIARNPLNEEHCGREKTLIMGSVLGQLLPEQI